MNPELLQNPLVEYILELLAKQAIDLGREALRRTWAKTKRTPTKQVYIPRVALIDREPELRSIQIVMDESPHIRILYFVGGGGVGKTRLLEEAEHLREEVTTSFPLRWGGILDLYHTELRSVPALQAEIVDRLDPLEEHFSHFRSAQNRIKLMVAEGLTGDVLEREQQKLHDLFFDEFQLFAEKYRPIIAFDTLESLTHESDWVEILCQLEGTPVGIREWLIRYIPRLKNTVILLAGRPEPDLHRALAQINDQYPGQMETIEIKGLTREDARQFLSLLLRKRAPAVKALIENADLLWKLTQGMPVQLSLAVELASEGQYIAQGHIGIEGNLELWGQRLVGALFSYDHPARRIFFFLALARKGLTADLLHYLEPEWSLDDCRQQLKRLRTSNLVKTRPEHEAFFLHDALYELFDAYFPEKTNLESWYERLAEYYRAKSNLLVADTHQLMQTEINLLFYELRRSPRPAFQSIYLRLRERAIAGRELELDLQLRDELLRYSTQGVDDYFPPIHTLPQAELDRDGVVRWIKRYIIQAHYKRAVFVAETVLALGPPPYTMLVPDPYTRLLGIAPKEQKYGREILKDASPLFWGQILTYYGEALVYAGASESVVCQIIEKAIVLLENDLLEIDQPLNWLRKRVLGRANHEMGYLMRSYGHYGLAFKAYENALQEFDSKEISEIFDEQAETLNNLAFVQALLGASKRAKAHVDQALKLRQRLSQKYPLALSYNTRGLIYSLQGQYEMGKRESQLALEIFEQLETARGIGLACNALGYILRRQGEGWAKGKIGSSQAIEYFQQSMDYLTRSETVFSEKVSEPIRLWEAYNEQGCLYRDWGRLLRNQRGHHDAQEMYLKALSVQFKALEVAQQHGMHFQEADTYDDLAWIAFEQDDHKNAEHWHKRALSVVPDEFILTMDKGKNFVHAPGEAYWLILGKAYWQEGVWAFKSITKELLPEKKQQEYVEKAIEDFTLAAYYFNQYWPDTSANQMRLHLMVEQIATLRFPVGKMEAAINSVAARYNITVAAFLSMLNNSLSRNTY